MAGCTQDTPIHLYRGTLGWGWDHIRHKHGHEKLFNYAATVEEMIWQQCGSNGDIHSSRDAGGLTVSITVAPTSFMVLRYMPPRGCFSITTMYSLRRGPNEPVLGQYVGQPRPPGRPVFAWLPHD